MTANALRALTCKDLAQLAKKDGVAGWHGMRKEELIRALLLAARRKSRRKSGRPAGTVKPASPPDLVDRDSIKKRYIFMGGFVLGFAVNYGLQKLNEIISKKVVKRLFPK